MNATLTRPRTTRPEPDTLEGEGRPQLLTAGGWVPLRLTDGHHGLVLVSGEWITPAADFARRLADGTACLKP